MSTSAARAYIDRLAERQAAVADLISNRLERPVEVKRSYRNVLNAIVIEAEAAEAAGLAAVPGVVAVEPDVEYELTTDTSHDLIGSAAIWGGDTGQDAATRGEGVVVGILDSGINPFHPSFAATDGEGYTHTNPYSGSLGVCAARRASRRAPALSRDVHPRVVTEVEKPRRVPIITSTRGHDHVGAALLQRRGKHHRSRHAATPTGRHQLQDRHTAELAADPPARHPQ